MINTEGFIPVGAFSFIAKVNIQISTIELFKKVLPIIKDKVPLP